MAVGLAVLIMVLLAGLALVVLRRSADPSSLQGIARALATLQAELAQMGRVQETLRLEVHRGREASLRELADAAQGIRGEIGQAQRALAEVKAMEQGRARQLDFAADSLRRLEAVISGSGTRGAAGENVLLRALAQLPPDLLELNVAFGAKVVEYALRLPGGRYLPIDSKWTSALPLARLAEEDDPDERRRLVDQIARDVRVRVREMSKYLDPDRTHALALLAVPDAVYLAVPEVHGEGYREGVLLVPYSLALPYLLALYRLIVRFGSAADGESVAGRLAELEESLRRADEEVEGRLSRGLVLAENARDALRSHLSGARRAAEGARVGPLHV
ncbi:MAG TPA: DNA recombination protein RmuC [Vicinamibacteria bacterium]